jgi:hypothetical protein
LISEKQISIKNPDTVGRAMAVLRGLLALLCVVSSAESRSFKAQSYQRVALASCRLPGVDGEARCGSYEVYEDRGARKGRKIALKIVVLPAPGSKDRIPQTPFRVPSIQTRETGKDKPKIK